MLGVRIASPITAYSFLDVLRALQCSYCALYFYIYTYNMYIYIYICIYICVYIYMYIHDYTYLDISLPFFSSYPFFFFFQLQLPSKKLDSLNVAHNLVHSACGHFLSISRKFDGTHVFLSNSCEEKRTSFRRIKHPPPPSHTRVFVLRHEHDTQRHTRTNIYVVGAARPPLSTTEP